MKIQSTNTYITNDGTTFETEAECLKYEYKYNLSDKHIKLEYMVNKYSSLDARETVEFLMCNFKDIKVIIEPSVEENTHKQYTYKGLDGTYYVSKEASIDSCIGCSLLPAKKYKDCIESIKTISCSDKVIIWVKK